MNPHVDLIALRSSRAINALFARIAGRKLSRSAREFAASQLGVSTARRSNFYAGHLNSLRFLPLTGERCRDAASSCTTIRL